jgi:hypothetical protein
MSVLYRFHLSLVILPQDLLSLSSFISQVFVYLTLDDDGDDYNNCGDGNFLACSTTVKLETSLPDDAHMVSRVVTVQRFDWFPMLVSRP